MGASSRHSRLGVPARRPHRPGRHRVGVRPVPPRRPGHGAGRRSTRAAGRRASPRRRGRPQPGNAVRLTIDSSLQRAAEKALVDGIKLAHATKDGWAADGGAIVAHGSEHRRDPGARVEPDLQAARLGLPDRERAQAAARTRRRPRRPTTRSSTARIDVTYPPGSTWKPVTALAALEQRVVSPYDTLLCSPDLLAAEPVRRRAADVQELEPVRQPVDDMPTALAQSCDTYFYQLGYDFYNLPAEPRPAAPALGGAVRLRQVRTGIDVGPEASGLVPTIKWRKQTFTRKTDPNWQIDSTLEAGRLDPARDRPEGRRRHADPARALLRAARERRQARDAVRRPGRRGAELRRQGPADRAAEPRAAAAAGRSASTRPTCR